jgi:adenosylmethionine-8-amino-7-oxononanoate aminotransferase
MVMLGPPLIIEEAQIDEIIDILGKTLAKLNP